MTAEPSREQELEETNVLLEETLKQLTGSTEDVGALMSVGHGITHRYATLICILAKRAPAVASLQALHQLFYGEREDGGPEPKIFVVHFSRIRKLLRRINCPGRILTVWGAGY